MFNWSTGSYEDQSRRELARAVQGGLQHIAASMKEKRMGLYLVPNAESLQVWLSDNCYRGASEAPLWEDIPAGTRLVCYMDQGGIELSAVIYDEREYKLFTDPEDTRTKKWYIVPIEALRNAGMHFDDVKSE